MPDYSKGKIYVIRSPNTEKIYIGSTINELHIRFKQHKERRNKCSSKLIIDYGNAYIELLEKYSCKDKIELNKKEGELIRQNKNNCVNYKIAGRTEKEYYNDNKEFIIKRNTKYTIDNYDKNKNRLIKNAKDYYYNNDINNKTKNNKKIEIEILKLYYDNNKDKLNENIKNYYDNNIKRIDKLYNKYNK